MKESVKNFIEKNILALEEEDIVLFLYLASVQLNRLDIDTLCSCLHTAGIEYEQHIPAVVEELVKDNVFYNIDQKLDLLKLYSRYQTSTALIILSSERLL